MISSLYIDGAALWIAIGLFLFTGVVAILLGCAFTAELRKNDKLEWRLKLLENNYRFELDEAYKNGYRSGLCLKKTESRDK